MADNPKRAGNEMLIAVVLALAVFAVYRPVAFFEFNNYDDAQYVTDNPHVLGGISLAALKWDFTSGYASNWHPLTWISHQMDCRLFGLDAGGHHLMNVIFHVANTLLLFAWLRKWTRELWPGLLVAALFAFHPLHVESVAWVAERKDVLSTFFGLLTLWEYGCYAAKPGWRAYGLVCLYYALGLLSKPMLVSLPLILLLVDFWPLRRIAAGRFLLPRPFGRGEGRGEGFDESANTSEPNAVTAPQFPFWRLLAEKLPLCLLAAGSCVVTYLVQQAGGSVVHEFPLGFRLANAINSYVVYLEKLFWPRHLAVFYPYVTHFEPRWLVADAALLIAITATVCALARKRPHWFVGWFWFLITLGPVIGLVQVGGQAYADRYTYVPAIGLFIALAWELRRVTATRPRLVAPASVIASGMVVACALLAVRQVDYWRNSITLFSHAIEVAPESAVAHSNLGEALASRGRENQALEQFDAALAIEPNHEAALNNKGALLFGRGNLDGAVALFRQTLRYRPDSEMAHNNLGMILFHQGKTEDAITHFRAAIKSNPDYGSAHANLGLALAREGKTLAAAAEYRAALAIGPNPRAENGLGVAWREFGRLDEAAQHFAIAVLLKPDFAEARDNLGGVLNAQGRFADAEPQIRAALRFIPNSAEARLNLGDSYAGLGHPAAAAAEYTEALRLATAAGDTEMAARIGERQRLNQPPAR